MDNSEKEDNIFLKKLYHITWEDFIDTDINKNIIKRKSGNNDTGKYILNDNFLLIIWDKWQKEYFYSINNQDYYLINDNNYFKLDNHISEIYLINENNTDLYLLDIHLQKIYKKSNLELYGNYSNNNNFIIINNENYIYLNYKYYNYNYFLKNYEIIEIFNNEFYKKYILHRDSNICFPNYNINVKKFYKKYKNKINIYNDNDSKIYYTNNIIYNTNENIIYNIYEKSKNTLNNVSDFINYEYFFLNNTNINKILYFSEYYNNFNINNIIFDNINNKLNNILYDDLNIIYYEKIEDLEIYISKYNIKQFYINNIDKDKFITNNTLKDIQLLCIDNSNINYNNDIEIIDYNIIDNLDIIDIKNIWYELNKDNLSKYNYLLNKNNDKIPNIMHFIWLGDSKIPDIYISYIESWIKKHDNWIFCFWNDLNIPKLVNQKSYDETHVLAMKADILRYELLYFFGGVYIDCDFLCFKNIEKIIENYDSFSGYESDKFIAIGIMGFKKYDNILFNIIKKLSYNININNKIPIPQLTGPIFFTNIWKIYKTKKSYAFPMKYFYSYTFDDKQNNKHYKINDDNYAIHMWGHSWKDNKNQYEIHKSIESYFIYKFYITNLIQDINKNTKNNSLSLLKSKVYFQVNKKIKKNIVNIMGLFFTGGIERYIYYIDKFVFFSKIIRFK